MAIVSDIFWPRVPSDDPLPHLLLEPRMLNINARDGLLARIVDMKALTQRQYSGHDEMVFEVIDELCPWNHGRWRLETSSKEAARMGRLEVMNENALPQWDRQLKTEYKPFCADLF